MNVEDFKKLIWQKGRSLYRDMPWRGDTRPYHVLVSELMLQQTQVDRVVPKFQLFIKRFPNERALAKANLADVLKLWQGLGYNRRAKYLHEAAKKIVELGIFPEMSSELVSLPGVGKNTAGAILAYSFNRPAIFIETNIRTVYIHHFFISKLDVDDKQISELLERTISRTNPREFYWALMDYGAWLKTNGIRNTVSSRHYKKQPPLKGSVREARGAVLRQLAVCDREFDELQKIVNMDDRFMVAVEGLVRDGLITHTNGCLHLTK